MEIVTIACGALIFVGLWAISESLKSVAQAIFELKDNIKDAKCE